MRKLFTILAICGLSVGFTALTASADTTSLFGNTVSGTVTATPSTTTVDYMVNGTFGVLSGLSCNVPSPTCPSTSISNAGDSFTITFSVDPTLLVPMMGNPDNTAPITVPFDYTDFLGTTVKFSLTGTGTLMFFDASAGGLFTLEFPPPPSGDDFFLNLFGISPMGFLGSPGMNSGTFPITPGDAMGDNSLFTETITTPTVPEPSSLLLLGSGFLALGGFARRRLIARFN